MHSTKNKRNIENDNNNKKKMSEKRKNKIEQT